MTNSTRRRKDRVFAVFIAIFPLYTYPFCVTLSFNVKHLVYIPAGNIRCCFVSFSLASKNIEANLHHNFFFKSSRGQGKEKLKWIAETEQTWLVQVFCHAHFWWETQLPVSFNLRFKIWDSSVGLFVFCCSLTFFFFTWRCCKVFCQTCSYFLSRKIQPFLGTNEHSVSLLFVHLFLQGWWMSHSGKFFLFFFMKQVDGVFR